MQYRVLFQHVYTLINKQCFKIIHMMYNGKTFTFKVQGNAIYQEGVTWSADNNVYDAKEATNAKGLVDVDTMSWWCSNGGGSTAGIAFVGALCSSYNVNLNEKQSSIASSGYVSSTKAMLLSSSFITISL